MCLHVLLLCLLLGVWLVLMLAMLYFRRYEDLQTTTAVYLQMKLLQAQPELDYPLLLQVRWLYSNQANVRVEGASQKLSANRDLANCYFGMYREGLALFLEG